MSKLKELRTQKGMTQKELATLSGVNVRVLQHYEQGSRRLDDANLETILNLCDSLECKLWEIIDSPVLSLKIKELI